jgi:hypothetical protein
VCLNGNAPLTLKIHRIQDLRRHFALSQATAHLDEAVGQGGFTMVDVGNDGKITDMTQVTHRTSLYN